MDFNLDDIIRHCGNYKVQGNEYVFQCPMCLDKGKDNLKFNIRKNVVTCFRDSQHAKDLLSIIYKEKKEMTETTSEVKQWMINLDEYTLYQDECNEALMANSDKLNELYTHRLINPFTVQKCGIGFDFEGNRWVIPVFRFDNKLVGFEYRANDLTTKKIWREKDTPSCMAWIYGKQRNKKLYIVEGFMDGYILAQWMDYNPDCTIMTPSAGVGSLMNCINEVNFSAFDEIILCLDNDVAGQKVTTELLELYPNKFIDRTPKPTTGKDITDLYKELVIDEQKS